MINVTQSFLPPIDEYSKILQKSWDKKWITNRGELILELENKLKIFLGIENITITTNGTLPLQIAIKALELKGEIITTPFSYIASSSVIPWENCTPVYVDIHPEYLTIDESKIEEKKQNIIKEWIFNHNFNEQFKKSFYLISEYRLINIKPTELLFLSLKTKFRNLYNIYIKTKKHD